MENNRRKTLKCELYNDNMQSWKCYPIQKAQLIIADVPYNIGTDFYGSNPMWYVGGIIATVKANLQGNLLFLATLILTFMNTFTFAVA